MEKVKRLTEKCTNLMENPKPTLQEITNLIGSLCSTAFTNKISATTAREIHKKPISLPFNSSSKPKFNSGSSMLGKQPGNIEWEVNFVTYKQTYNPNRCFSEGLGGILSQNLALLTFHKIFSLKAADIQVDNTTPLSYLMKIGWAGSRKMTALVNEIWKIALSPKNIITVEYLPRKFRVRAANS